MSLEPPASWHPDRSWANPLIALLALLALLSAGLSLRDRQRGSRRPSERVGLQGRILEVALSGPQRLAGRAVAARDWAKADAQLKEPWDRALLMVLKQELAGSKEAQAPGPESTGPAGPAGDRFRRVWLAAYAEGTLPIRADRDDVHRRLGDGYAADLLEARLRDREGGGEALRVRAQTALVARLAVLGLVGLGILALGVGGLAFGIFLLATQGQTLPRALPVWSMSGRAAAVVLLSWFLAFGLAGSVAGLLLHPWPGLRWLILPLGYALHA